MNNLVDLAKERRINGLIGRLNAKMGVNPDFDQRTWAMLNGELPMVRQPLPTSLRLPEPLIERLDRLAEQMNADPQRGLERRHKRSDALREALIRGISELESDLTRDTRP
jgi:predicted DNA-binding protein